ncbi:winged helix-turn-helix transcriptional regulator [Streptomyces griseosporeus]|uniref:winged helix-turn-helix transcriptional regulator n=1 Tax=Streptomyces griseosporeus TaxID=1910 RepID=UPI0037B93570
MHTRHAFIVGAADSPAEEGTSQISRRFAELRRRLDGVTPKVLTQTLRALEREGLLTRTLYPTVPPRVEYRLTGLGRELGGLIQTLTDWSQANITAIRAARREFDERAEQETEPVRR